MFLAGCKKQVEPAPLKVFQAHAVTREMLRAASGVIREPGHIESKLEFDGTHAGHLDHIGLPYRPVLRRNHKAKRSLGSSAPWIAWPRQTR